MSSGRSIEEQFVKARDVDEADASLLPRPFEGPRGYFSLCGELIEDGSCEAVDSLPGFGEPRPFRIVQGFPCGEALARHAGLLWIMGGHGGILSCRSLTLFRFQPRSPHGRSSRFGDCPHGQTIFWILILAV